MKIAFLNIYNGFVDRGAETFVKEIASRLSDKHTVVVFQSGKKTNKEAYLVREIPVKIDWTKKDSTGTLKRRFFVDYWSLKVLGFTLKSIKSLVKERFDLMVPLNGGWQVALVRIITWLYGGKMIVSGQSGMGWDDLNNLWSFPDVFIALSTKAQKWAKERNPFIKSLYIPNGVNLNKFNKRIEKIDFGLKKPVILCVSALTKTKRVDLVIKAVSKMKNTSLLIVGDGDQKEYLFSLASKLLKGRHKFLKIPYQDIQNIYHSCDIFTLTSEPYYAFEIVITEAMASGLGVVVNNDPIRKEIVGNAGLFVNPTNSEEYANVLKKALKLDWSLKAKKQAENFSWDKIAKDYEKLFEKIIK